MLPVTRRLWKTAFLPLLDFASLMLGSALVYVIRYRWITELNSTDAFDITFSTIKNITPVQYGLFSAILSAVIVLLYAFLGLYNLHQRWNRWQTFTRLFLGIYITLSTLIIYFFFNEYNRETFPLGIPVSRFILAIGGALALYCVILARLLFWLGRRAIYFLGKAKTSVVLIGQHSPELVRSLKSRVDVVTVYEFPELTEALLEKIQQKVIVHEVTEIYLRGQDSGLHTQLAYLAERAKILFYFYPTEVAQYSALGVKSVNFGFDVYLEIIHTKLDGWMVVLKRLFDIAVSVFALILFSPILLFIAFLIKKEDGGPIFYLSDRVGPDGNVFKLFKFRRLKKEFCTSESDPQSKKALEFEEKLIQQHDLRKDGILYKIQNDPRSTRIGNFIEKTSIDELPQFLNVLLGNMSIVGPRPHQPREVKKYKRHHYKVLNIKPGITGLAQINGRSDLNFDQEVALDVYYLENWSLWMDIVIIIKTPLVILFGRHKG